MRSSSSSESRSPHDRGSSSLVWSGNTGSSSYGLLTGSGYALVLAGDAGPVGLEL
jgi:hypothetical protein